MLLWVGVGCDGVVCIVVRVGIVVDVTTCIVVVVGDAGDVDGVAVVCFFIVGASLVSVDAEGACCVVVVGFGHHQHQQ